MYEGRYTRGARRGELCVSKEMRSGPTWLSSVFENEITVVERAAAIIDKFNDSMHIDKPILINHPEIWEAVYDQRKSLVEPFI